MVFSIAARILRTHKKLWTLPFRTENQTGFVALAGATTALVGVDPYVTPYFRKPHFERCKTGTFGKKGMGAVVVAVPAATYATGLLRADERTKETAMIAAEAIVHTQLVSLALKTVTGRMFPCHVPKDGNFRKTWFKYGGPLHDPGSFPSGHAMAAFAAAAVYSDRYKKRKWVSCASYGLASIVALTRIPDQTHFPSDVFAGAVLGYAIGKALVPPSERGFTSDSVR